MSTIPANVVVNVTPNVLSAGGSALDLNGMVLTDSTRVPIGTVARFTSAAAVRSYFGASSPEAIFAGGGVDKGSGYFGGFRNSNKKPGAILFTQYNRSNVAAYLRGGNVSAMTLAQLQAISGPLAVTIDGVAKNGTPDLSTATSFSNAALILAAALGISGAQVAAFTGAIAGTQLTVSAVDSGLLDVGQVVKGVGIADNTYITALGTGVGGPGTYTVNNSQTISSEAMTANAQAVSFDPVTTSFVVSSGTTGNDSTINYASGSVATSLKMTQSTGAILSPGANAAVPAAFMAALVQQTQNWASFSTTFNPDSSGFANKLAFAAWVNGTNKRFCYVGWDTDAAPAAQIPATASFGYQVRAADYNGTVALWEDQDRNHAAFVLGSIASIDFQQTDGRITFKFRSQDGLVASVSDENVANNLLANGYNYYGAYATANDDFLFLADGTVSGDFQWLDSYVNQIWLNNSIQLALVSLLVNSRAIPYNSTGYAKIESSLSDVINQGLSFGVFRPGVTLSSSQVAAVNAQAGRDIAGTLSTRGWYLQILDATPEVRQARGSPPMTFWYVDGQAVQQINLASIAVQ